MIQYPRPWDPASSPILEYPLNLPDKSNLNPPKQDKSTDDSEPMAVLRALSQSPSDTNSEME